MLAKAACWPRRPGRPIHFCWPSRRMRRLWRSPLTICDMSAKCANSAMSASCFWQTWDKMDKTLPLARRITVTVAMMKSWRERNGVRLPKNGIGSSVHYQFEWPISTPSLRIDALIRRSVGAFATTLTCMVQSRGSRSDREVSRRHWRVDAYWTETAKVSAKAPPSVSAARGRQIACRLARGRWPSVALPPR